MREFKNKFHSVEKAKALVPWRADRHICSRSLLLIAALAMFGAAPANAIVDLDGDGMSDVWQQKFGAVGINPNGDDDGDGQTNFAESVAGTNPFDATSVFKLTRISVGGGFVMLALLWT